MGLLLAPRPAESSPKSGAPEGPPAPPTTPAGSGGEDRSPRASAADRAAGDAGSPAPETALAFPDELALSGLLPSIGGGETAAPAQDPAPGGTVPAGEAGPDSGGAPGRGGPVLAGMAVGLAILTGGGGFLWWRNRDSRYWPA